MGYALSFDDNNITNVNVADNVNKNGQPVTTIKALNKTIIANVYLVIFICYSPVFYVL